MKTPVCSNYVLRHHLCRVSREMRALSQLSFNAENEMQEELWRGQTCKMQSLSEEALAKVRASTFGIAGDCSKARPRYRSQVPLSGLR